MCRCGGPNLSSQVYVYAIPVTSAPVHRDSKANGANHTSFTSFNMPQLKQKHNLVIIQQIFQATLPPPPTPIPKLRRLMLMNGRKLRPDIPSER